MRAVVKVRLKDGVLDPQGKAIENAAGVLGLAGIAGVRQGKLFEIEVAETDAAAARETLERFARDLLANPVIETYTVELASE